jgi:hypothetical protein
MSITVTEKQELKSIINKRIDRTVSQIETAQAKRIGELKEKAREQAISSLEVADFIAEERDSQASIKRIEEARDRMRNETAKRLGIEESCHYWKPQEKIEEIIEKETSRRYQILLAETDFGAEIKRLEEEQEAMLETVWAATSSSQVKELFKRVNDVLRESPTALGAKALDIKPTEE